MRKSRPTLRSGVLLFALSALTLTACDRGDHPARIGSPAPQFTLADGGQTVSLSSLRGRTVVLNFWATWCVPCVEELPSLLACSTVFPRSPSSPSARTKTQPPITLSCSTTTSTSSLCVIPPRACPTSTAPSRFPKPTSSTARESCAASSSPPRTGPTQKSSTTSASFKNYSPSIYRKEELSF